MSKVLNILIFLFITLQTFSQKSIDTLYYNKQQQPVETPDPMGFYRVISVSKEIGYQFLVEDYYSNNQLKMSGIFQSINPDKKNGSFKYYYPSGTLQKSCTYNNNMLEGDYSVWFENGTLKQHRYYKNNRLAGTTKTWQEDGSLEKMVEYKDGLKHGKFITYYKSGTPIRIEKYRNNELISGRCFTSNGNDTTFYNYYTPPKFLGGDISKFTGWVAEKLIYPNEAKINKEEGNVKVKFTIDSSGKIESVSISKPDKSYFNSEVLRVIANSPLWSPAKNDNKNVDITVEIPVKFSFTDD